MKNQCYLIFALTFFILIFVSSAYAEDNQTASYGQDSLNNTGTPPQNVSSSESPGNSVISGKVHDCITNDPFPGVNLTVSYNGSIIASNITNDDGSYQIKFLSNYNAFNVTASHIGHNSVTKEITLSPLSTSEQFGSADFRLGTTTLYPLTYVNILTGNDSWTGNSSTYHGDNIGPKQTIQAGINATEFGGTLNIASGVYYLAPPGYLGIAYELEVNRDLTIYGEDRDSTIVSGCLLNRVFMINSGNVTIANLTIANGQVPVGSSSSNGGSGGGIFNQGNLTLQNCILCNNTAGAGGDGTSSHSAGNGGNGGAIYNTNTLTLIDCDLYNNQAGNGGNAYINLFPTHDGGNGGSGGAIYNCNTLNIDNCNIYDNSAGKGGYSQGGDTAKSGGDGGAIYNNATSLAIITNSYIYNNSCRSGNLQPIGEDCGSNGINGGNGGAIYNNGIFTLENCTLNNNQAGNGCSGYTNQIINGGGGRGGNGGNGGAICNLNEMIIIDCELSNNYAGNGGNGGMGIEADDKYVGGQGGSGGAIYNNGNLTITGTLQNSVQMISNSAGAGGNGGPGQLYIEGANMYTNFDPGNGGNGGNGGAICNIGIIKFMVNSLIQNNRAGNGGNGGYFLTKVNDAGHAASNPGSGGFGGGIYSSGEFNMENITITNNAAGNGGNGNVGGIFQSSNGGAGGNGGGIYISYPSKDVQMNVVNCNISNNTAGNGGNGGQTENLNGWMPASQPGNGGTGGCGGGIFIEDDVTPLFSVNIINSIIDSNSAGNGGNGGIDNYYSPQKKSSGGNGGNGGGIEIIAKNYQDSVQLMAMTESTLTNNKVGTGGSGKQNGANGIAGLGGGMYANGFASIWFSRIVDNTPQAIYLAIPSSSSYPLYYNWWGSNQNPKNNITGTNINSGFYAPWLVLSINATSNIDINQVSNVTANLIMDSNGYNTLKEFYRWLPDGIPATFTASTGTMFPTINTTMMGSSNSTFTPGSVGEVTLFATVDYQTVNITIDVSPPAADVEILKAVYNGSNLGQPIQYGDSIEYWISVINNGPENATGLVINEPYLPLLEYLYCTYYWTSYDNGTTWNQLDPSYNITTGNWNISTLLAGSSYIAKLVIFGQVNKTGNFTNTANKTHEDQYDPTPDDTASANFYVPPTSDIQITYLNTSLSGSSHDIGDKFTIYYKLGNNGPDNATDVTVKIPIPEGMEFVKASVDQGSCYYDAASRTLIWHLDLLEVGDPYLNLTLFGSQYGQFSLNPLITSANHLLNAGGIMSLFNINIISVKGNVNDDINGNSVEAAGKTIEMQTTGTPLLPLLMTALLLIGGCFIPRKK